MLNLAQISSHMVDFLSLKDLDLSLLLPQNERV